jgi:hypothetical protein
LNKIKRKKYYVKLHLLEILSKNRYFFIYIKHKKNIDELEKKLKKLNHTK